MNRFEPTRGNYKPAVVFTMRFTTHMNDRLQVQAEKHDLSRAELVRQCIEFALDSMEASDATG